MAWLEAEPSAAFREDVRFCLGSDEPWQAPHMSNLSVALQCNALQMWCRVRRRVCGVAVDQLGYLSAALWNGRAGVRV